jgi:hypothetical protein
MRYESLRNHENLASVSGLMPVARATSSEIRHPARFPQAAAVYTTTARAGSRTNLLLQDASQELARCVIDTENSWRQQVR